MMARMAAPLSTTILLAFIAQSHGDKACADKDAKIATLTAELEALKKGSESYVTTQVIVDAVGNVLPSATLPSVSDIDLGPVTDAVSKGYGTAKDAIMSAVDAAHGLHKEHVLPHASEYYKAAGPHMEAVQKVYYDQLHPHVGKLTDAVPGIRETLKTSFEQATLKVSAVFAGSQSTQLLKLYEPRTIEILGWKKMFKHGCLDIALFFMQAIANLYVGSLILWKVVGKLGFKVTILGVKFSLGLTSTTVSVSFRLVYFLISSAFTLFMLGVCCALGVSLMHGIEKSAKLGLDANMRLMVGLAVGAIPFSLVYLCCCCCKRRSTKKDTKATDSSSKANGKAKAKPEAKASGEKAKAQPKKPAGKK
jgi:hypothetical protein